MKQVWQASDGTVFQSQADCRDHERQAEWVWQLAEQSGLNDFIANGEDDYKQKLASGLQSIDPEVLHWLVEQPSILEFLCKHRSSIFKLSDVMKRVTQEVYGTTG